MALKEICGLWVGETKSGKRKLSGKIKNGVTLEEDQWLMVLKNESKSEGAPGYRLFVQVPDDDGPQSYEPKPQDTGSDVEDVPF